MHNTEEVTGAQNFNFPKMGIFSPKFCIFGKQFSDKKFFQQAKT